MRARLKVDIVEQLEGEIIIGFIVLIFLGFFNTI